MCDRKFIANPTANAFLLQSWQRAWSCIDARPNDTLRDRIIAAYAEPHRVYHSLQHLIECLETLARCPSPSHHPGEVAIALWFHDAIYEVQRSDNERQSAAWAREELLSARVALTAAERVYRLVLATQHATPPQSPDAQWLVDVDLSILGAAPCRFAEYEAQVRQEYAWIPGQTFRRKRCQILQGFLARSTIYNTVYFRNLLEANARENLQRSVAQLAS